MTVVGGCAVGAGTSLMKVYLNVSSVHRAVDRSNGFLFVAVEVIGICYLNTTQNPSLVVVVYIALGTDRWTMVSGLECLKTTRKLNFEGVHCVCKRERWCERES